LANHIIMLVLLVLHKLSLIYENVYRVQCVTHCFDIKTQFRSFKFSIKF